MLLPFHVLNNTAGKKDLMQHANSANTNIQISEAPDINYTFFRILNSKKTWLVISNTTFCMIFRDKVMGGRHRQKYGERQ